MKICTHVRMAQKFDILGSTHMVDAKWLNSATYKFSKTPPHWGFFVVGGRNSGHTSTIPRRKKNPLIVMVKCQQEVRHFDL